MHFIFLWPTQSTILFFSDIILNETSDQTLQKEAYSHLQLNYTWWSGLGPTGAGTIAELYLCVILCPMGSTFLPAETTLVKYSRCLSLCPGIIFPIMTVFMYSLNVFNDSPISCIAKLTAVTCFLFSLFIFFHV